MIGEKIGHTRIESLIGSGGSGDVYRGFDEILERAVAVKSVSSAAGGADAAFDARFLREARVLSKLDHPNICRIYNILQGHDCHYLILEFIEGITLRAAIQQQSLNDAAKLGIALQIAQALVTAHDHQIIHRDLKPDNVMITPDLTAKVLDFGLARAASDPYAGLQHVSPTRRHGFPDARPFQTEHGTILGTLHYMSPEQARGEPVTTAADMYSFGLILQEFMTGNAAYPEHLDSAELYDRVIAADTLQAAELDADLNDLIVQLKLLDPAERPSAVETERRLRLISEKPLRVKARKSQILAVLLFIALLFGAVTVTYKYATDDELMGDGQEGRVALMPFFNATGDHQLNWVEYGLMEMVAQTLDTNPQLDVIAHDSLRAFLKKNPLQQSNITYEYLNRANTVLGCQYLVTATVTKHHARFQIEYALYDARGFRRTGVVTNDDLILAAGDLSAYLNRRLARKGLILSIHDQYSDNAVANQNYAIGLQRLSTGGAKTAQSYFLVCLDLDPQFLWAKVKLAACKERLGEKEASEKMLREVLQVARAAADPRLEAESSRGIGMLLFQKKDYSGATDFYQKSLSQSSKLRDKRGEAKIWNNLGLIALENGKIQDADRLLRKSIAIKKSIGDKQGEAFSLCNLAVIASMRGDRLEEEKLYRSALRLSRQIGDVEAEALALGNLGALLHVLDRNDESLQMQRKSLDLCRQIGDAEGEAAACLNLAEVLVAKKQLVEAKNMLDRAAAWYKDEPELLVVQGKYFFANGNIEAAVKSLLQAKQFAGSEWSSDQQKILAEYQSAMD